MKNILRFVGRWAREAVVPAALLSAVPLLSANLWVAQRPYVSPGTHMVLRQDSDLGALLGPVVMMAAMVWALVSGRARRIAAWGIGTHLAAVLVASLLTPRTIVSIGDGYCYYLWCIGVEGVKARPQGREVAYTADVRIFSDANKVSTSRETGFLHVVDERGRQFPLTETTEVTIEAHRSFQTSLTFRAPALLRVL